MRFILITYKMLINKKACNFKIYQSYRLKQQIKAALLPTGNHR